MNIVIKNKIIELISSFLILYFQPYISAQQKYLLSDRNMEEYKLKREINTYWPINTNLLTNRVIEQEWINSQNEVYYISYCEFDNEEDAIKGIAYHVNSYATPFIFGSSTGEILGNLSWVSIDRSAVVIQKGSVGIKIFKPIDFKDNDRNEILNISNKVLNKVSDNIQFNVKIKDSGLISNELFSNIINEAENLITKAGFSEYEVEKTKWLLPKDSLIIGFRKQWSKNHSIFSMDIALFSDSIVAKSASEFRRKISLSPLCKLNNDESILLAINEWLNTWRNLEKLKYLSIIGIMDNLSVHFYCYNDLGIDFKLVYNILKSIY